MEGGFESRKWRSSGLDGLTKQRMILFGGRVSHAQSFSSSLPRTVRFPFSARSLSPCPNVRTFPPVQGTPTITAIAYEKFRVRDQTAAAAR